jgi:hypothetical protein
MSRFAALVSAALIAAATPRIVVAQAAATDPTPKISFGGYVDGYYAWDFGRPSAFDRAFAGVDVTSYPRIFWRNELRGLHNKAALFPDDTNTTATKNNIIAVTSLSLSF